ncbi:MAG TPA: hypothetical protein VE971_05150, partial [Candidatus Eisenbacteria bacterium]|nr:hypothetical protein [Candidatus Eisenbacteria bacterium]
MGVDLLALPYKSASPTSNHIATQTLEGYVLPLLLHNLHFNIGIHPECYLDLNLLYYDKNNGKHHSENIGTTRVD